MDQADVIWPRDALPKGTAINGYRIDAVVGRGGFGITYRATDGIDQVFAVKECFPKQFAVRQGTEVLPSDHDSIEPFNECLKRFGTEARALRQLADIGAAGDGVVKVATFFQANGTAYVIMEFLTGNSLDRVIKSQTAGIPAPQLDFIVPRLLHATACVHSAGLLHRDIKPANIILREDGRPVLIDFGAARTSGQGRTVTFTQIFSEGYAPIEQFSGTSQGPFSDIYALGATLYRAIGGTAVDSFTRHQALLRGKRDPQPLATQLGAGRYAPRLLAAIDAAMIVAPEERPQSVAELLALLQDNGAEDATIRVSRVPPPSAAQAKPLPPITESPPAPPISPPTPPRARLGLGIGLGALAVAVAAGAIYVTQQAAIQQAPPPTQPSVAALPKPAPAQPHPDNVASDNVASDKARNARAAARATFDRARKVVAGFWPEMAPDTYAGAAEAQDAIRQAEGEFGSTAFAQAAVDFDKAESAMISATSDFLTSKSDEAAREAKSKLAAGHLSGAQIALQRAKQLRQAATDFSAAANPPQPEPQNELANKANAAAAAARALKNRATAAITSLGLDPAVAFATSEPLLARAQSELTNGQYDVATADFAQSTRLITSETATYLDQQSTAYAAVARRKMRAGDLKAAQSALDLAKKIKSSKTSFPTPS